MSKADEIRQRFHLRKVAAARRNSAAKAQAEAVYREEMKAIRAQREKERKAEAALHK